MKAGMCFRRTTTMAGFPAGRWTALPCSGFSPISRAGKVDVVVVYKIDRLTRSLFDFAKIVEVFDANGVSFVSVTQQFNTTTSMGRLTLNVLLSFAQFEREVTSERIRDKIAASKKKGMWMGGAVPLGYDAVNRKLRINAEEAKTVRLLFDLYLKLGSVRQLQEECQRLGFEPSCARCSTEDSLGEQRSAADTSTASFPIRSISAAFHTRVAATKASTKPSSTLRPGTRSRLSSAMNAGRKRGRASSKHPSLLAGLLFTADGVPFTPSHAVNHGRRYRYYVERSLLTADAGKGKSSGHHIDETGHGLQAKGWRLPAHEIEQLVLKQLVAFLRDRRAVLDVFALNQNRRISFPPRSLAHRSWPTGAIGIIRKPVGDRCLSRAADLRCAKPGYDRDEAGGVAKSPSGSTVSIRGEEGRLTRSRSRCR